MRIEGTDIDKFTFTHISSPDVLKYDYIIIAKKF